MGGATPISIIYYETIAKVGGLTKKETHLVEKQSQENVFLYNQSCIRGVGDCHTPEGGATPISII